MKRRWTIERALADPKLLGAAFGALATWSAWLAVLKAAFGSPLTAAEEELFRSVAGGRAVGEEQVRELWAIVGRRGGKSRVAAALAVFVAAFIDHARKLSPGEIGYVLVLAASMKQASVVFSYVEALFEAS